MTAHEVLGFYATLKLCSRSHSAAEVAQRIDQTLTMTGLTGSRNTACGGVMPGGMEIKGLSGGEKRRLSIACSLLALPAVRSLPLLPSYLSDPLKFGISSEPRAVVLTLSSYETLTVW